MNTFIERILRVYFKCKFSLNLFFSAEMGVMPEIAQAVEELDWL